MKWAAMPGVHRASDRINVGATVKKQLHGLHRTIVTIGREQTSASALVDDGAIGATAITVKF